MQNLGAGAGGANKVHCYGRCASSEINRHSFSPPEPLVLIDHETKRNDGLCGREYLLFKPDGKVAGFLTLVSGKLRCVNFMRCPKGIRSMGSNNNLLNEYFRAKYIDTQNCFTFPSPFFVGYKNPTHYPLSFSSIFIFERILFWMNQGLFYSFSDENSRKRCVNLKRGFLKF